MFGNVTEACRCRDKQPISDSGVAAFKVALFVAVHDGHSTTHAIIYTVG